eukprot:766421-Hanusia_phi.AAC.13
MEVRAAELRGKEQRTMMRKTEGVQQEKEGRECRGETQSARGMQRAVSCIAEAAVGTPMFSLQWTGTKVLSNHPSNL